MTWGPVVGWERSKGFWGWEVGAHPGMAREIPGEGEWVGLAVLTGHPVGRRGPHGWAVGF